MKTAEVREARRLFLYGAGDGQRVISAKRLVELTGCHIETIRKHLPAWEAEAEEILSKSAENGLGLRVTAELLAKHEADVTFLRKTLDSLLAEAAELPDLLRELRDVVRRFMDSGEKEAYEVAADAFGKYLRTFGTREALNSQILTFQKRWKECAGIESLQAVAETREKTLASGRAKLRLKSEAAEAGGPGPDGARVAGSGKLGGVFAKRAGGPAPVEVESAEADEDFV